MDPRCCPKAAWRPLSPEGEVGAGVEGSSEGPSQPGAIELDTTPWSKSPKAAAREDVEAQQKDLERSAELLKQKRITPGHAQTMWGSPWGFSLGRCSAAFRRCRSV